jgi:hypothetical protein
VPGLPFSRYRAASGSVDGLLIPGIPHLVTETHLLIMFQVADFAPIVANEGRVTPVHQTHSFVVVDKSLSVYYLNLKAHFGSPDSFVCC